MNNPNNHPNQGLWDQIAGSWKQVKGTARKQWGKLTDDDLEQIGGQKDLLVGKLQQHYGMAEDEAQRQADEWSKAQKF